MFNLKTSFQSKKSKQYISLFSVNILGIPLALITSIITTRYLGAQLFGDYNFVNSIFTFTVVIANLGLFQAGNRALVLCNDNKKNREYYGTMFVVGLIITLVMEFFLLLYVINDSNISEKNLVPIFICVIPFGFIYLANNFYETLLHADNRISLLSIIRIFPKLFNLLAVIFVFFFFNNEDISKLLLILYIHIITQLIVFTYAAYRIKPIFKNIKSNFKTIFKHYKNYGFDIYIGAIVAVGFASLTEILISYFSVDNTGVGFYTLAVAFSAPLLMIPSTIATTNYKEFSTQIKIPSKLIVSTTILSILAVVLLWIVVPPFVEFFYGNEMMQVVEINKIVSIGVFMHGMADFFNRYLGANGKGKILRNASFIIGFATLGFNLFLIPKFGAVGAAYTKIGSAIVYLSIMIFSYKMVVRKNMMEITK